MIGRTLSHVPTLASLNIRYKKTVGHKFRDAIATCGHYLKPFKKYVFPNFLAVHYIYIITMTIITSILLYPVKNASYIDILFMAAGCTTQGGLNTINVNDLTLYQQIILYIICFFCTPIAIHGCLAFVRLYWFERYFDNIRDSSKKNFRMRRTRTILERELTSRTISKNKHRNPRTHSTLQSPREDFQEKLFSGKMLFREEGEHNNPNAQDRTLKENPQKVANSNGSSWSSSNTVKDSNNHENLQTSGALTFDEPMKHRNKNKRQKEKFVGRRRSTDISPEDMFRSITMLQDQHREETEEDGPPLVIGAPNDGNRENDVKIVKTTNSEDNSSPKLQFADDASETEKDNQSERDSTSRAQNVQDLQCNNHHLHENDDNSYIQTVSSKDDDDNEAKSNSSLDNKNKTSEKTGPLIQFDVSAQPKRRNSQLKSTHNNPKYPKSLPRKAILKGLKKGKGLRQRIKRRWSANSMERPDSGSDDDNNMEEYFADNDDSDESDASSVEERPRPLNKAMSFDQNDSVKPPIGNRLRKTGSFDVRNSKDIERLAQSPDFQSMIYENWKKKNKKQALLKRRKGWNKRIFDNEDNSDEEDSDNSKNDVNQGHGRNSSRLSKYFSRSDSHGELDSEDQIDDEEHESTDNDISPHHSVDDEEEGYYGLEFDPNFEFNRDRPRLARTMSSNYLSWQPTIGRNSTFVGLSKMQKEELGGVEYTSIKLLCKILVVYYFGFFIMAFVMLLPWISCMDKYEKIVRADGVSPTWWGFFTSMSAFTDFGLTLTPDSMNSFNKAIFPLITMMWFIVIGNTGFPILLRFIIWVMFKVSRELSQRRENLGFLLDHPRRCFTLLFPSAATWWLLATLLFLNITDLILFIILDFHSAVLKPLSHGFRVLDGLFQAISTRTAGFTVVDLSQLHPSVQVSYMLMMYVSVLPLAISIRRTNVYEEQSLGLYGNLKNDGDEGDSTNDGNRSSNSSDHSAVAESDDNTTADSRNVGPKQSKNKLENESFIGAHLRKQLSFDLWFLFLGLFIICICEGGKIQDTSKPSFNVFSVLFEIVSAYGTVGLSLGYPNSNASFSGQFTTLSKLVIIAMLIRGRHRGLPYALDRAIILPSERLDNIDHIQDLKLRRSIVPEERSSNMDPVTAYFKQKSSSIRKTLRKLRRTVSEPEEHLLHSYTIHNQNQDYNLTSNQLSNDDMLQDTSTFQNNSGVNKGSANSLDSGINYDDDSYEDDFDDENGPSNQAPIAFHHNETA